MLSVELLKEILSYDPETGLFRWVKECRPNNPLLGKIAGGLQSDGYWCIEIDHKPYRAHHLAWLWMYGSWPNSQVDHIDGCRTNNAIANLRLATSSENIANSKLRSDNTSGFKGVCRLGRKWRAKIAVRGRRISLGMFDTAEEAGAAYLAAAKTHFGEFARAS
ncbi:HNH endonuclease signature motif containing protein [Bradyrhizobium pachyrhizi]|uniref:HNH endonuclease signature motif containing protein n=1 Tax=Bradyrhizobium pachyrhizi TaxID=280333 RepID=UPI003D35C0AB